MDIIALLKKANESNASDLHIKVGSPPVLRIDGELTPLISEKRVSPEDVLKVVYSVLTNEQKDSFKREKDIDFAYGVPGVGRFRCNVFIKRGSLGIVSRVSCPMHSFRNLGGWLYHESRLQRIQ